MAGTLATASLLIPAEMLRRSIVPARPSPLPQLFHKALARALGLQIFSHGQPASGPLLFVANHVSWADIPLLGSRIPRAAFIAKADVAGWGPVGRLATLARTIYVARERRAEVTRQRDMIADRLMQGGRLILFPEGTNSDGVQTLKFKSALFSVIEGLPALNVQPVTLAYTRLNGLPVTRRTLPGLAWLGDTELLPHARVFTSLGRIRADLIFHPPVSAADFPDRKALAQYCQTQISEGYRQLMRSGPPPFPPL